MSDKTRANVTVQHAESGLSHQVPILDTTRATPGQLIEVLAHNGKVPATDPSRPYLVFAGGRRLDPDQPFSDQGIVDGNVLTIVTRGEGAATTPERRRLDWETLAKSFPRSGPIVSSVQGFAGTNDALRGKAAADGALASVYQLEIRLPSVAIASSSPGWRSQSQWRLRIDASAAAYPTQKPEAMFLGEIPFNPHVNPQTGWVCQGSIWQPTKLIAFLVLDILRLLNFDFAVAPDRQRNEFSAAAVSWWRDERRGRPLNEVAYPEVLLPEVRAALGHSDLFGSIE